jgi:hypothetical protein
MLIQLYGDVLSFNLGAVQGLFRASCIFFSPKFYYTRVHAEAGLGVRRSERAEWAEEIVELRIGIALRKMLYEARRRARRWEGSVGSSWGIWRKHEKDGWG